MRDCGYDAAGSIFCGFKPVFVDFELQGVIGRAFVIGP